MRPIELKVAEAVRPLIEQGDLNSAVIRTNQMLVTSSGVMIDRVVGGKITEEWEEYDALGMMQQLGAVEPKIG
jgi:hypothetical protein